MASRFFIDGSAWNSRDTSEVEPRSIRGAGAPCRPEVPNSGTTGTASPAAAIACPCGWRVVLSRWMAVTAAGMFALLRAPMVCPKCGAEGSLLAERARP